MAGSGVGQFDQQFIEQGNHVLVDIHRAIVGMEGKNHKRKLIEEVFQHRNQVPFADCLDGTIVGGCYHVMGRGLERRRIFQTTEDKEDFLTRLALSLQVTHRQCFA